jgi:Amidohydrolase family
MRTILWAIALTAFTVPGMTQTSAVTALVDVHVVPMDRERVLDHQTVLVSGPQLVRIGPVHSVAVPVGALRIEGRGRLYVAPGLADMHTHAMRPDDLLPYVANGVTTILHMGGAPADFVDGIQDDIDRGAVVGPQVIFAFMVDGSSELARLYVRTPEQARASVQLAKANGYRFVKVYNNLSSEEFAAIVDEGRRQGLPVIGHGVRSVGLPQALFEGQVMVAHAEEFFYTAFHNRIPSDQAVVSEVVEQTYRSGAYVTPNLSTFATIAKQWGKPQELQTFLQDPRTRFLSPNERLDWSQFDYVRRQGDITPILTFLKTFTKALADRGVPLLAGTDSPGIPGMLPGYSIHEDLQALTEAGLTPYQALAAATRTAGEFMARYAAGIPRFGRVEAGMRADLIVLDADPLQSISALEHPVGVMSAGRWRTREKLDELMAAQRATFEALLREPAATEPR